ncbi:metallopeptidase family protein [Pseudooctadecabacter jejudonensis]|uniref:Possibl zinc metallo-peptidase n=1 Tax=Pseudooctadecabacter jejudonensis TaxID=1391910 RepID=A0A1Y5SSL8_9RHOB|nr:metallopeptidase family protein [Pseudooctadecabacter jejudonensis]SLN46830.1 Possibl zinc metallo-peptidase [Pseudooctadecabacter jejudonensis]
MTTLSEIERIALETVAHLPAPFGELAQAVVVQVEDWIPDHLIDPDEDRTAQRDEITGLYDGIPLTEKSTLDMPMGPDVVWLFRQPILMELADRDVTLAELVSHVTIHEFAHHFGWSDDDIAAIDRWWE